MSDVFKLVTANRLGDGLAVWLGETGWVDDVTRASPLRTEAHVETAEAAGRAAVADREVVDLATIEARIETGAIVPVRLRERIRAAGPTVRRDLGYQARGGAEGSNASLDAASRAPHGGSRAAPRPAQTSPEHEPA